MDIVFGFTISQSGFKYDEKDQKQLTMAEKRANGGKRETFGYKRAIPARLPRKAVTEEEGENEQAEGSYKEDEEYDTSL